MVRGTRASPWCRSTECTVLDARLRLCGRCPWRLVNLAENLRLKDLLGPVTRVKKKKRRRARGARACETRGGERRFTWIIKASLRQSQGCSPPVVAGCTAANSPRDYSGAWTLAREQRCAPPPQHQGVCVCLGTISTQPHREIMKRIAPRVSPEKGCSLLKVSPPQVR